MQQLIHSEYLWLNRHLEVSLTELAALSGVDESEIREWMDEGLIHPTNPQSVSPQFGADRVEIVVKACRLRRDFELEPHGVALVVQLLERIRGLEAELCDLQARHPGGYPGSGDRGV